MDPKINVLSSDHIFSPRLGVQGSASTWGQQGLRLSPDLLGKDCSHGRAWLMDRPLLCTAWELSAGDGELPLTAGGEVQHQPPPRLFLGPKLQPSNVFCLCTDVCPFSALLSCSIWVQSPLMLESREMWQLFMSVERLDAAQPHHSLSFFLQPSHHLLICPFCCAKSDPAYVTQSPFPRNTLLRAQQQFQLCLQRPSNSAAEKEKRVTSSAISFS